MVRVGVIHAGRERFPCVRRGLVVYAPVAEHIGHDSVCLVDRVVAALDQSGQFRQRRAAGNASSYLLAM